MCEPNITGARVLAPTADANHIADRVDGDREAELAHPGYEQIATGAILVAEREPTIAAARQGADLIEAIELAGAADHG